MTLLLCIETAAPSPMMVLGDDGGVLFEDAPEGRIEGPVWLRDTVQRALREHALAPADIDAVAVDLGPGGLTATRSGVTFANALAYGLGRPLVPLGYFDLVAAETGASRERPVVCVRPTTAGEAFMAICRDGGPGPIGYGSLEHQARQARDAHAGPVLAGVVTPAVKAFFPDSAVGAQVPGAATLLDRALASVAAGCGGHEPLEPLTSMSPHVVAVADAGS